MRENSWTPRWIRECCEEQIKSLGQTAWQGAQIWFYMRWDLRVRHQAGNANLQVGFFPWQMHNAYNWYIWDGSLQVDDMDKCGILHWHPLHSTRVWNSVGLYRSCNSRCDFRSTMLNMMVSSQFRLTPFYSISARLHISHTNSVYIESSDKPGQFNRLNKLNRHIVFEYIHHMMGLGAWQLHSQKWCIHHWYMVWRHIYISMKWNERPCFAITWSADWTT